MAAFVIPEPVDEEKQIAANLLCLFVVFFFNEAGISVFLNFFDTSSYVILKKLKTGLAHYSLLIYLFKNVFL